MQAVRKERDPINLLTAYALEGNLVTEDELKVEPSLPSNAHSHGSNVDHTFYYDVWVLQRPGLV